MTAGCLTSAHMSPERSAVTPTDGGDLGWGPLRFNSACLCLYIAASRKQQKVTARQVSMTVDACCARLRLPQHFRKTCSHPNK
jgi:hypothetical protein